MDDASVAVPAQPDATSAPVVAPALSAVEAAIATDNVPAYREARRAERSGTPAPAPAAVPVPDAPPAALAPPVEDVRQVSKRQHDTNERIRLATERAVSERDAEIARLRSQLTPAPAPAETFPLYAQYLDTHPEASLEDYIDARQDFRDDRKARTTQAQRQEADQLQSMRSQVEAAQARTRAARAADPALDATFRQWEQPGAELPEILTIRTHAQALDAQEVPGALNDFATAVAASDFNAQIVHLLATRPELLDQIRALENRTAVNKFVGKLETRFEKAADAAPSTLQPISSAPTPGVTLGSRPASQGDPVTAAVKGGDFTAFRAAKRAREQARR